MRSHLGVLVVLMLVIGLFAGTASGQGFSSILQKLQDIEKRLDEMEGKSPAEPSDSPARFQALESRLVDIENQLKKKHSSDNTQFIENSIVELSTQVLALEEKLSALENRPAEVTAVEKTSSDEAVLAELRGLIADLRSTVAANERAAETQPIIEEESEEEEGSISLSNIEFSGFFDLIYLAPEDSEADKGFAINQMELDISSAFSPYITIEGAIAWGDEAFEVGAAFADLHWMGEHSSHPVSSGTFDHSGVVVGQFDVPFGADCERIASPDRSLFSVPLAVEHTVDGWNDVGLSLYGGRDQWETQVYFVNGDQDNMAYGGRVVFNISEYARLGGSAASILDGDDNLYAAMYGGDLLASYEPVEVIAEYILKQDAKTLSQVDINAYYGEVKLSLDEMVHHDIYLVGGYSAVEYKDVELSAVTEKLNRVNFGAGFNLNDNASLRLEYLIDDGDNIDKENSAVGQFVVSF